VANALTKSLRSSNPHNVVRAVFDALRRLESAEQYATRTGKDIEAVRANYTVQSTAPAAGPA